ncbi:Rv1733c family protein [Streptomyces tailanensis]|uniref:Rv1733c family protein n=1 Tax=Streptomyces tailanensis TaxID=2569858 RepID=UPI003CCC5EEA
MPYAPFFSPTSRGAWGVGTNSDRIAAKVRWTDPDSTVHTDRTLADSGLTAGSGIMVWTDGRGQIVTEPPSPAEAAVEAGVFATAAGLAFAGLAFGAGALARWRLDLRRVEQWGREWDLVGPRWSHKTG